MAANEQQKKQHDHNQSGNEVHYRRLSSSSSNHSSRRLSSPPPPDTHPPPDPSTDPHHQFTISSMVCLGVQKGEPLYGVLQWVGTVPDFNGTIAGVELVSDYEKCAYSFNTINRSDH